MGGSARGGKSGEPLVESKLSLRGDGLGTYGSVRNTEKNECAIGKRDLLM